MMKSSDLYLNRHTNLSATTKQKGPEGKLFKYGISTVQCDRRPLLKWPAREELFTRRVFGLAKAGSPPLNLSGDGKLGDKSAMTCIWLYLSCQLNRIRTRNLAVLHCHTHDCAKIMRMPSFVDLERFDLVLTPQFEA